MPRTTAAQPKTFVYRESLCFRLPEAGDADDRLAVSNLDSIVGLPDEEPYGVRVVECILSSGHITRKSRAQYEFAYGSKWFTLGAFDVFEREDGKPMQAMGVVDMSRCKGQSGLFILAEYLPLKDARSGLKKESQLQYVDVHSIKRMTDGPQLDTPDLAAYVKSLTMFKDIEVLNPDDLFDFVSKNFIDKLEITFRGSQARVERYIKQNLQGQMQVAEVIRKDRRHRLKRYQEYFSEYAPLMAKPTTARFVHAPSAAETATNATVTAAQPATAGQPVTAAQPDTNAQPITASAHKSPAHKSPAHNASTATAATSTTEVSDTPLVQKCARVLPPFRGVSKVDTSLGSRG